MKKICKYCAVEKDIKDFRKENGGSLSICNKCYNSIKNGELEKKIKYKVCEACFYNLPIISFNFSNKSQDGFSNVCKVCINNKKEYNKSATSSYNLMICCNCNEKKSSDEFYRKGNKLYLNYCRKCIKEITSGEKRKDQYQVCNKCGEKKVFSHENFPIDISKKGFLHKKCKKCGR